MDCKTCELKQRQFFCENCLRTHLRDFRLQTAHFSAERDESISKASKSLPIVKAARTRRADVASMQRTVDGLMQGLTRLRRDNEQKRDRLRILRETIATRRQTLSAAKLVPTPRDLQAPQSLTPAIARARAVLVQELVEVFNVVEVGGRPPIGGKAGTKGEWTIGDLILPVPGDIRRYPPDHINAVITHTIHFVGLLTFYLGIKLPFEVNWSGNKLGVGQPWIGAIRGSESGGWAKWYRKHPLHLTSSTQQAAESVTSRPAVQVTSESYIELDQEPQASFTTAFAMLLYNVSYLAFTQNVDVPLNQAGDILNNLWSVCCSSDLGKRSHEAHPYLPPPTPSSFALDFSQLLQATTANPVSRTRPHKTRRRSSAKIKEPIPEVDEDGWDLVEDTGFRSLEASGGGDGPEAQCDALTDALNANWKDDAAKVAILITDSPPHGIDEYEDKLPDGCPNQNDPARATSLMADNGITLHVIACEPTLSGSYSKAHDFYTRKTGGSMVALSDEQTLSDLIIGRVLESSDIQRIATTKQNYIVDQAKQKTSVSKISANVFSELSSVNVQLHTFEVESIYASNADAEDNANIWFNASQINATTKGSIKRVKGFRVKSEYRSGGINYQKAQAMSLSKQPVKASQVDAIVDFALRKNMST